MKLKFSLTEESNRTVLGVESAAKDFDKRTGALLKNLVKQAAKDIRNGIERQTFGHYPLTKRYLARKLKEGLDPRILMATKDYVESIKPVTSSGMIGISVLSKEAMARMEFGTKTIRARPHFVPVINRIFGKGSATAKKLRDALFEP